MHWLDTLAVNALMLNIDTSLPIGNSPLNSKRFEEHALIFSVPFVCSLFQGHAHNRGTNDYSRKLHPLEQFSTGTEYYTTPAPDFNLWLHAEKK